MARYQNTEEPRKTIDARGADARGLRLRGVHRDMGGNILSGTDQLTGQKVEAPPVDGLQVKVSTGFEQFLQRGRSTWAQREGERKGREADFRERNTPGAGAMKVEASRAGEAARDGFATLAAVPGAAGLAGLSCVGRPLAQARYRHSLATAQAAPAQAQAAQAENHERIQSDPGVIAARAAIAGKAEEKSRIMRGLAQAGASVTPGGAAPSPLVPGLPVVPGKPARMGSGVGTGSGADPFLLRGNQPNTAAANPYRETLKRTRSRTL